MADFSFWTAYSLFDKWSRYFPFMPHPSAFTRYGHFIAH